jgi:hypothetical protein
VQNTVTIFPSYYEYIIEAIISLGTLVFNLRQVHVGFVVDKVAKAFLLVLHFPLVVPFHNTPYSNFIYQ